MTAADSYDGRSDEDLALAAARDPEGIAGRRAAEVVFGRYLRTVYRWCYRYVQSPELAEDLAQEVLAGAYRNLGRFEGWGRFSAWLFVLTRNRCFDALRRPSLLSDDEIRPDSLAEARPGPDRLLEERLDEEELLNLLRDHLSAEEQDALWLRCIERLPVDTVTRTIGIVQASGARGVLQSARRKLRAVLERRPAPIREERRD
jgi:RNA polymerase sigma-70 factor, ECF subfamily